MKETQPEACLPSNPKRNGVNVPASVSIAMLYAFRVIIQTIHHVDQTWFGSIRLRDPWHMQCRLCLRETMKKAVRGENRTCLHSLRSQTSRLESSVLASDRAPVQRLSGNA